MLLLFYNWILLSVFNRCFTLCYWSVFIDYISDFIPTTSRYHVFRLSLNYSQIIHQLL